MKRLSVLAGTLLLAACASSPPAAPGSSAPPAITPAEAASYTDAQWKSALTPEQYRILRQEGTERPFTSALLEEHRPGTWYAADCGVPLFRTEQKYESGTGWPSFWAPASSGALRLRTDTLLGYERTEVLSPCGGHLGHVFTDGPEPTGLRYCMNGDALVFVPD